MEKIKNIVIENKMILIDYTNKLENKILENKFENKKTTLEKQLIKGFWEFTYIQDKATKLKNVVFMIDVNKLYTINLALFLMLQECGIIYKQYENNIILIHSEQSLTIQLNIDFHKSVITNFLNDNNYECNICFNNKNHSFSCCHSCGFHICLDCVKHNNNNNNICYQCGKEIQTNEIKKNDSDHFKKLLIKLLKKHKNFKFRETYQ
jgi:hypothetical protein